MLTDRNTLNYPPYSWVSKIEYLGPNVKSVSSLSNKIKNEFFGIYKGLEILGPAPCFKEKVNNKYRFQIILKYERFKFRIILKSKSCLNFDSDQGHGSQRK